MTQKFKDLHLTACKTADECSALSRRLLDADLELKRNNPEIPYVIDCCWHCEAHKWMGRCMMILDKRNQQIKLRLQMKMRIGQLERENAELRSRLESIEEPPR